MASVTLIQIPMTDVDRAVAFYQKLLGRDLEIHGPDNGRTVVFISADGDLPRVMLLHSASFEASRSGSLVYLSLDDPMDDVIGRVKEAGGEISFDKMETHGGFIMNFVDSEGNTIGVNTKS